MSIRMLTAWLAAVGLAAAALPAGSAAASGGDHRGSLRVATFNASLNRATAGALRANLSQPDDPQAGAVAEIIQRARPDLLLINEFDFDPEAARLFQDNYLSVGHNGARPITYPHRFIAPSNTGVAWSGFDLNNDGRVVTEPGAPGTATTRSVSAPSPASSAWSSLPPPPSTASRSARSRTSGGATCLARCCPTTPPRMRRRTGTPRAELAVFRVVVQGHWDPASAGRQADGALPRQPPDAAGVRRSRGPQRPAQLRRDPVLGGLRAAGPRPLHLRRHRTARRPSSRVAVRGGELTTPTRTTVIASRVPCSSCLTTPVYARHRRPAPERSRPQPCRVESTPRISGSCVRHRGLRGCARPWQPSCRLRSAVPPARGARWRGVLASVQRPVGTVDRHLPFPQLRPPPGLAGRAPIEPAGAPIAREAVAQPHHGPPSS